jgi:hypothetical protein
MKISAFSLLAVGRKLMPGTTAAQCTCAQDTLAQLPFAQERKRFLSRLYCQLVDARSQAVNHDEMGFEWKQIYLVLLRRRFRVVPPSFACDFVIQNHKSSSRRRLLQIHYNSYTTTTRGFCILMLQQLDLGSNHLVQIVVTTICCNDD